MKNLITASLFSMLATFAYAETEAPRGNIFDHETFQVSVILDAGGWPEDNIPVFGTAEQVLPDGNDLSDSGVVCFVKHGDAVLHNPVAYAPTVGISALYEDCQGFIGLGRIIVHKPLEQLDTRFTAEAVEDEEASE